MHLLWRAGALPRGTSRRVSVQIVGFEPFAFPKEGSGAPKFAGRNADPLARLMIGPVPPAGGNCRPITRTGAPLGAPLRRFPSSSGPPSGNGQGRPFERP